MFDSISMLKNSEGQSTEKTSSIYVGNIPWKASPEEIGEVIYSKTNVRVKDVRIVKEKGTGRSRGFAFVDMPSNSDADKAIKSLNKSMFQGREIKVNQVQPQNRRDKRAKRRSRY